MSLAEIKSFYPEFLHNRAEFLLREYLQYKILEILFQSKYASKFVFWGGTCLRIVYNNRRFSEDLDFDNFDLSEQEFELVSEIIKTALEKLGYEVEIRNVMRAAFHCYIRFPGLLFKMDLSGHKEAKILINLDTEPQKFDFQLDKHYLNKFDVYTTIFTTPIDILLSQKFVAITQRKRPKGRDFFDAMVLMGRTKPNYDFLNLKLGLSSPKELKSHLIEKCEKFDFEFLAKDVQPFLFYEKDVNMVLHFLDYLKTKEL